MEVCVKQERFESEFDSKRDNVSTPWEIYGSWVKTGSNNRSSASTELIVPLSERSEDFEQRQFEAANRGKREFIPDDRKDVSYWNKRIKNNASARRSRLKKKVMEKNMEAKLQELQRENIELKFELAALRRHFADKLEGKQSYEDVTTEARSDLSMRTGSGSDTSDSGSVTSEGESLSGAYETDRMVSPHLTASASTSNRKFSTNAFPYNNWTIPFNYSFIPCPMTERGNNSSQADGEVEVLAKIPHKFRHKKDFHSAFYVQPFSEDNS